MKTTSNNAVTNLVTGVVKQIEEVKVIEQQLNEEVEEFVVKEEIVVNNEIKEEIEAVSSMVREETRKDIVDVKVKEVMVNKVDILDYIKKLYLFVVSGFFINRFRKRKISNY